MVWDGKQRIGCALATPAACPTCFCSKLTFIPSSPPRCSPSLPCCCLGGVGGLPPPAPTQIRLHYPLPAQLLPVLLLPRWCGWAHSASAAQWPPHLLVFRFASTTPCPLSACLGGVGWHTAHRLRIGYPRGVSQRHLRGPDWILLAENQHAGVRVRPARCGESVGGWGSARVGAQKVQEACKPGCLADAQQLGPSSSGCCFLQYV